MPPVARRKGGKAAATALPEQGASEIKALTPDAKQRKRKQGAAGDVAAVSTRKSPRARSKALEVPPQPLEEPQEKRQRVAEPKPETEKKAGDGSRPKRAKNPVEEKGEKAAKGSAAKFPNLQKELRLKEKGYTAIAGVDEAGRGPLAGPVVAAAAILPPEADDNFLGVDDSKKISEDDREAIYEKLMAHPGVHTAVSVLDHRTIDDINILASAMKAMANAVAALPVKADFALIDGNRSPEGLTVPGELVIKGDAKCTSIAAASIVAKVTRDRLMRQYHEQWPQYNFAKHKGYGTAEHMAAIHAHGPSPIHRMTFAPLKHMFPQPQKDKKKK